MQTLNSAQVNITKTDTPQDLAVAAFDLFISQANITIAQKGVFNVAISGGNTPELFFKLLGQNPDVIKWEKVQLFWVDERCVPPDNDASNYALALNTFLDKISIPSENIHRMIGESCDYSTAITEYENLIRDVFNLQPDQFPKFDFIVLGMGSDGHIGSLFPNSYALIDTNDLVTAVYLMDGSYNRMTLTHPVLRAAEHLVILVSGEKKAHILKEVMQTTPDEIRYPAHILWPILSKVTWLVDSQAGKFIF